MNPLKAESRKELFSLPEEKTAGAFQELQSIYDELHTELDPIAPPCKATGYCCNFAQSDMELYCSPLELEYALRNKILTGDPHKAREEKICPYLLDGKCSAREHRMLACRIYFCAEEYQVKSQILFEKYLDKIKILYRKNALSWRFLRALDYFDRSKA